MSDVARRYSLGDSHLIATLRGLPRSMLGMRFDLARRCSLGDSHLIAP